MTSITEPLNTLLNCPAEADAFEEWIKLGDVVPSLLAEERDSEILLYLGGSHAFIHGVLLPRTVVEAASRDDLLAWNFNASSSWGICTSYSEGAPSVSVEPPLSGEGVLLKGAEQLVYSRFFEGRTGRDKSYIEVLQRFLHIAEIHYIEERDAYCRIDELGDLEDIIRIVDLNDDNGDHRGTAVYCVRTVLDEYMALTDTVLYRTFDFSRFRPWAFDGWPHVQPVTSQEGDICYREVLAPGVGSYMRGAQLVRSRVTTDDLAHKYGFGARDRKREYASFLANDWKNKRVAEISCAPGATANYFTESDLPFEMTPAFFRPEVLTKYRADSEKYVLTDRSITCRGAWYLKTYDINEAGQVHTYLVYLRDLPYREQLHWKAYNEPPKGSISRRAFTTDIEGRWDEEYDPLNSLKAALREASKSKSPWWRVRSEDLWDKVHYPATSSADEWADELLRLDQLLVEGFDGRWLKKRAVDRGQTPLAELQSLGRLEHCLVGMGCSEERSKELAQPLRELHDLRTKLKGHANGSEAIALRKALLTEHRSFRQHFRHLCQRCDESIRCIWEVLGRK